MNATLPHSFCQRTRPCIAEKRNRNYVFLSSTDNVPFGVTSRAKATLDRYYTPFTCLWQGVLHTFLIKAHSFFMAIIFIRTIVVFIALLLIMRLMGKRQIGEMQPYELVITLIIADLACIPMEDPSTPLLYGIVAILTVYFLHQTVCLIDLTVSSARKFLSGSPSIVINKNGIDDTQLKKNNLDVSDLIESLRVAGYFSLDSVEYALYEAGGSFSALPKAGYEQRQNSLPVVIVSGGKFDKKNVALTGKDEAYFRSVLSDHGCNNLKKVLVMTVDGEGKGYLQQRGKKYEVFSLGWEGLW